MVKTPFRIQSVSTPSKDMIARALYGKDGNARDIIQAAIDETDSYISRGMRNGVRLGNAETIQKGVAEGIHID